MSGIELHSLREKETQRKRFKTERQSYPLKIPSQFIFCSRPRASFFVHCVRTLHLADTQYPSPYACTYRYQSDIISPRPCVWRTKSSNCMQYTQAYGPCQQMIWDRSQELECRSISIALCSVGSIGQKRDRENNDLLLRRSPTTNVSININHADRAGFSWPCFYTAAPLFGLHASIRIHSWGVAIFLAWIFTW